MNRRQFIIGGGASAAALFSGCGADDSGSSNVGGDGGPQSHAISSFEELVNYAAGLYGTTPRAGRFIISSQPYEGAALRTGQGSYRSSVLLMDGEVPTSLEDALNSTNVVESAEGIVSALGYLGPIQQSELGNVRTHLDDGGGRIALDKKLRIEAYGRTSAADGYRRPISSTLSAEFRASPDAVEEIRIFSSKEFPQGSLDITTKDGNGLLVLNGGYFTDNNPQDGRGAKLWLPVYDKGEVTEENHFRIRRLDNSGVPLDQIFTVSIIHGGQKYDIGTLNKYSG